MRSLTINCVTRGRPDLLVESVRETLSHITLKSTRLIVSVDDDDTVTLDALDGLPQDKRVIPDIRPREDSLGAKYNRALDYPADLYMPMNDSAAYVTDGFDARIVQAARLFPDGIGAVYGHMHCEAFAGTTAFTAKFCAKIGFFFPPYFPYWFVDHWNDDIARLIDRVAFADVTYIRHPSKGPTRELRDLGFWATLFDSGRIVRRRVAHAIINGADFKEPAWRKKNMLVHHPMQEYRSQFVNDYLRANAEGYNRGANQGEGGERYDRLKAQADGLMAEWAPDLFAELHDTARLVQVAA